MLVTDSQKEKQSAFKRLKTNIFFANAPILQIAGTHSSNKAEVGRLQKLPLTFTDKVQSSNSYDCFYYKNPFGEVCVHIHVVIKNGATLNNAESIATLPAGFRPQKLTTFFSYLDISGQNITKSVLDFGASGTIFHYGPIMTQGAIICDAKFLGY